MRKRGFLGVLLFHSPDSELNCLLSIAFQQRGKWNVPVFTFQEKEPWKTSEPEWRDWLCCFGDRAVKALRTTSGCGSIYQKVPEGLVVA